MQGSNDSVLPGYMSLNLIMECACMHLERKLQNTYKGKSKALFKKLTAYLYDNV